MREPSFPDAERPDHRVVSDEAATCVGRFVVDNRTFHLLALAPDVEARSGRLNGSECAKFSLYGRTLLVIERPSSAATDVGSITSRLTERELQIAAMVARGRGNKNIAHDLRISEWTVATHLRRIFAKLNVDNRAAMVYRCSDLFDGPSEGRPGKKLSQSSQL